MPCRPCSAKRIRPCRAIRFRSELKPALCQSSAGAACRPEFALTVADERAVSEAAEQAGAGGEIMHVVTPNQSYLVKRMQTVIAACLGSMVYDLQRQHAILSGRVESPAAERATPRFMAHPASVLLPPAERCARAVHGHAVGSRCERHALRGRRRSWSRSRCPTMARPR